MQNKNLVHTATNTLNVSATNHYGTKYYKVKAYATDGVLTSSTSAPAKFLLAGKISNSSLEV